MKSVTLDSPALYLASISLLVVIALLMLLRRRLGDPKAGRYLLCYFLAYLYLVGSTYILVYGNPEPFIHLLRTGQIAALLMPVFAFFYIRQSLYPEPFRMSQLWHLVPVGFFLFDFGSFFMLSASEKLGMFNAMDVVEYRLGMSQGWLVPKFGHMAIRFFLMLSYWVAQAFILWKARNENFHPLRLQYPFTWRWLHIFLGTYAISFIVPIIGFFLASNKTVTVIIALAGTGSIAVQCFYLLLHPEILYTETFGRKESSPEPTPTEAIDLSIAPPAPVVPDLLSETPRFIEQKVNEEELILIAERVSNLMDTRKPYQIQRYNLHNFSTDTGIPPYKLSAFVNTRYGINFNDYLNKYRIAMVVEMLQAGENARVTLEAVAQQSGFQSRTTFIRAFKKEYNMTPSEYLQTLNQ